MSRIPKPLNLATLLLILASGVSILPISFPGIVQPVQAQTNETQQTEAERLLKLCREHLSKNQAEAAIQSCRQAVTAHQQIQDRAGEAKSSGVMEGLNTKIKLIIRQSYGFNTFQSLREKLLACLFQ